MSRIRSFLLHVSDAAGAPVETFAVPVEGAAFFINPLFRAILGTGVAALHEPWYRLIPRRATTTPLAAPGVPVTDLPQLPGSPPVNLLPDPEDPIRAITVTLYDLDRELYTGEYTTTDVFGPLLRLFLQQEVAAGRYEATAGLFRLRVEAQLTEGNMQIFSLIPEGAPVEGVFPLPAPRQGPRRTTFQRITQHQFAEHQLDELGEMYRVKPELSGKNEIIWRPDAYLALTRTQPVSDQVEVGGYLVGQVYEQAGMPGKLLVEVQQVLAAVGTQASAALLLFTGDSWSALRSRFVTDLQGLQLLGWWHTHLFPATDTFGLSGLDETLHRQFFSSSWHFAALLNLSHEQGRVLRCYQPDDQNILQESPYLVVRGPQTDERSRTRFETMES